MGPSGLIQFMPQTAAAASFWPYLPPVSVCSLIFIGSAREDRAQLASQMRPYRRSAAVVLRPRQRRV
jgi:hypothetical protein